MTNLEIILSIALYLIIGLWLSYKREWYKHDEDQVLSMLFAIAFMPLNFITIIIRELILRKWNN